MERRQQQRLPVTLPAMVYLAGIPITMARTQDLSRSGLCLIVDGLALQRDTALVIELYSHDACRRGGYRLPATVMHHHTEHLGLRIEFKTPEVQVLLQTLMNRPGETRDGVLE